MQQFLYINWNPDLFAFQIGSWGLRWYSICWFIGLASAFFIVKWLYNHQNITFQERVYGKEKTKINVFEPLFRCTLRTLHFLSARILPHKFRTHNRDASTYSPHAQRQLEIHRLRRIGKPRRHHRTHDSPVALLPQVQSETMDRS